VDASDARVSVGAVKIPNESDRNSVMTEHPRIHQECIRFASHRLWLGTGGAKNVAVFRHDPASISRGESVYSQLSFQFCLKTTKVYSQALTQVNLTSQLPKM
jgi:hypothetical protein